VALVALSVGLGVGLIAQERGLRQASARVAAKFDLILAAPGDEIAMLMATVYLQPTDAPLLDGAIWDQVNRAAGNTALTAPIAYGDSWQGHPLVGGVAPFVTHLAGDLAEGRMFATNWQAVIGARVSLSVGARLSPAHGEGPAAEHDAHDGVEFEITGRMAPTGSPWDDAIITPIESVWLTHGLGNGHTEAETDHIGPPFDPAYFPGTPAILIATPDLAQAYGLQAQFATERSMAFFPGAVLARLHGLMGNLREVMSVLSLGTQILVAASVMAGLIVLSRLFARRLALLQALGAPARMIFALVWAYAALLLGLGAALGLGVGLSAVLSARSGLLIQPHLGWSELHLVAAYFTLALLVALVPAALALTRPVTQELRR
jgi:putative ABC transport system permease protein